MMHTGNKKTPLVRSWSKDRAARMVSWYNEVVIR